MKKCKILAAAMATMLCSLLPMQVSAAEGVDEQLVPLATGLIIDYELIGSYGYNTLMIDASTDALIEKANAIASELVMNSSAFSVNTEMSAINETKADIVWTRTVSDYVFDAAVIKLAQNGSVKKLQFEYCDVPAGFTPAALDAVLEDYLLEKVAATYGEDHTDFEISHSYFMSLNNMIYGAYSVTVTYGDLNQYSDVIGVVVYDE